MFENRSVAGLENRQFGGINELSNFANIKVGSALDMLDWEVDPTLAIRRRDGHTVVSTIGTDLKYAGSYYTNDGIQVFVAVCDNKFWEATDPAGPWTDRTGTVVLTGTSDRWIGADMAGKFVLTNGVDAPIVHELGKDAQTLKDASRLLPPDGLATVTVGTAGSTTYNFVVTAITARGETVIGNPAVITTGSATLDATNYIILTWNLRAAASGYRIYRFETSAFVSQYRLVASVGSGVSSYSVQTLTVGPNNPPLVNTAYTTPTRWDSAPPTGFVPVARGRSQRMVAFGKAYLWASALSDPLTWTLINDSFDQPIYGGKDCNIIAGAALYDYTVLFSKTNTFVYTGSTCTDFSLSKVLDVGCLSHHSIVPAGDNLYFWSELGPNSFARVGDGQDIQTAPGMNTAVQNTVSTLSNREEWGRIVAWNHIRNNRIVWAYPNGTSTVNDRAILFAYSGRSDWSRHSVPPIVNAFVDDLRKVYVATTDGKICEMHTGATDAGATITGTYQTGWYDSQSFLNRQIVHLDVVTDKSVGDYDLTVEVFWDFSPTAGSTHTLNETSTDGIPVVMATTIANIHRLWVKGFGRYFSFKFTVTDSPNAPRVMGWRPEMYSKGIR